MIRFLFACLFYTVVARWGYQEIGLVFPAALPVIDQSLQKIQIPTHNRWSRATFHEIIDTAGEYVEKVSAALDEIHSKVKDSRNA